MSGLWDDINVTTASQLEEEATLWKISLITVLLIESATAIILDALCIAALIKRRLHKEENKFIFMVLLALAEMLAVTSFAVQFITGENYLLLDLLPLFRLGNIGCAALNCASTLALCLSMLSLLLLSTDQFLRIEFSLEYLTFATRKNAIIQLSIAFAYAVFDVVLLITVLPTNSQGQCSTVWNFPQWYYIYGLFAYVVLPLCLITVTNARIWYISVKQHRNLQKIQAFGKAHRDGAGHGVDGRAGIESCQDSNSKPASQRHWRTSVTVAILVGSLLLCYTPMTVCMTLSVVQAVDVPQVALGLGAMFSMVNYIITPTVYIVRIPEVKGELKRILQTCHWGME